MNTSQIRETLQARTEAYPAPPLDGQSIIKRVRRQRRRQRVTLTATAVIAAAGVAAAAATTVTSSDGRATLIPAATPFPVERVEALTKPLVLPDEGTRLEPAGNPPASAALVRRFLEEDKSRPLAGPNAATRIVYALLTIDSAGIFQQSQELGADPFGRTLTRYPVIVIIHTTPWPDGGQSLMAYTVLDPTSAKPLYAFGQDAARWMPAETPDSPGYYVPEVRSASPGITRTAGPFPSTLFRATTKWVKDLGYQKRLGRHAYVTVYAGTDYGLFGEKHGPTAAVIVVRPAYMTNPNTASRVIVTAPQPG